MKFGARKPSIRRSISARTTGRVTRSIKKSVIPSYGKKSMGWIHDPKKATYNKIYNKTTFGLGNIFGVLGEVFSLIGGIIALIFGLIQMAFYLGVLYLIFYFIYRVFISF
ncbi:TPA: hypothetical protein I9092_001882 [Clostridium perfringens]|uniref:hypothetical protein n=1 Tax=Clostridium perfringens TaxID=1502 RepID=UPI001A1D8F31|nr:hypothetical protein [Clostridium perfringens]HAT4360435.1 hypothetical protein [Clostridium perfringens]HAT4367096.1 hypothetical protein [Clostridium perfringens]